MSESLPVRIPLGVRGDALASGLCRVRVRVRVKVRVRVWVRVRVTNLGF